MVFWCFSAVGVERLVENDPRTHRGPEVSALLRKFKEVNQTLQQNSVFLVFLCPRYQKPRKH